MNNSSKFPKVQPLKQYIKENKPSKQELPKSSSKELKLLLGRRDFLLDETTVLINLATVVSNKSKEIDKNRLIKLIRLACDIRPKIAFYGWNTLMLRLDIKYGTKECLTQVKELKEFITKHGEAYKKYIKAETPFEWVKPNKELLKERYDELLCLNVESETSKLKNMWSCVGDDVYYVFDDFYQALLDYGYSKEQLRGVIHRCEKTKDYSLIPLYLRKKYLAIPDGDKAIQEILYAK